LPKPSKQRLMVFMCAKYVCETREYTKRRYHPFNTLEGRCEYCAGVRRELHF
jgi:hypothetical protein